MMKNYIVIVISFLFLLSSCNKEPNAKRVVLYEKFYFIKETEQTIIRPQDERLRLEFVPSLSYPEFVSLYRGDKLIWLFQSSQYGFGNGSFFRWECFGPTDLDFSSICLKSAHSCLHFKVKRYNFPTEVQVTGELVGIRVDELEGVGCSDRLIMSSEN